MIQFRTQQAITQSQEAVEAARKKVEADKKEINDTIQNSAGDHTESRGGRGS